MFTFLIQAIDYLEAGQVGLFFAFFIANWTMHGVKLGVSQTTKRRGSAITAFHSLTVIVPVFNEDLTVWKRTLTTLADAVKPYTERQVIVVANGHNDPKVLEYAKDRGFEVVHIETPSKRMAIAKGAELATGEITVILDSDTQTFNDSITSLLFVFGDSKIGGATPHHKVYDRSRNITRRISDWLEDIRFQEIVRGQNRFGAVSCLPGRMLAVRTEILKEISPSLVSQRFLGSDCISGDDRYITSEILKRGYQTVYVPGSVVYTEAPDTLGKFVLQRLRWSRTSFRETLRSIPWTWKHKYMTFTVFSTLIMRWFFFIVILTALLAWLGFIDRFHFISLPFYIIVMGTVIGFLVSGFFRQFRHLMAYPQDLVYLPVFLFVTTFILTPVEWFGNLTVRESGWMTRKGK